MGAQHLQGHEHGLELKARKRPWPRLIVSCVAIILILVVSCYFHYRNFLFPVPGLYWASYHFICLSMPFPIIPPFTHTLSLSPRGSPVFGSGTQCSPACTVILGWVERDGAWPDRNLTSEDATLQIQR